MSDPENKPLPLEEAHRTLHAWEYGTQPTEDVADGCDNWWWDYFSETRGERA